LISKHSFEVDLEFNSCLIKTRKKRHLFAEEQSIGQVNENEASSHAG